MRIQLFSMLLLLPALALLPGACGEGEREAGGQGDEGAAGAPARPEATTPQARVLVRLRELALADRARLAKVDTRTDREALAGVLADTIGRYREICGSWPAGEGRRRKRDHVLTQVVQVHLRQVPRLMQGAPQGDLLRDFTRIRRGGLGLLHYILRTNAVRLQALLDALAGRKVDRSALERLATRMGEAAGRVPLQAEDRDMILDMVDLGTARLVEEQGCRVQEKADMLADRRTGVVGPGGDFLVDVMRDDMEACHILANEIRAARETYGTLTPRDRKAIELLFRAHRDWSLTLADHLLRIMQEQQERRRLRGDPARLEAQAWTSAGAVIVAAWLERLGRLCRGLVPLLDASYSG